VARGQGCAHALWDLDAPAARHAQPPVCHHNGATCASGSSSRKLSDAGAPRGPCCRNNPWSATRAGPRLREREQQLDDELCSHTEGKGSPQCAAGAGPRLRKRKQQLEREQALSDCQAAHMHRGQERRGDGDGVPRRARGRPGAPGPPRRRAAALERAAHARPAAPVAAGAVEEPVRLGVPVQSGGSCRAWPGGRYVRIVRPVGPLHQSELFVRKMSLACQGRWAALGCMNGGTF